MYVTHCPSREMNASVGFEPSKAYMLKTERAKENTVSFFALHGRS